VIESRPCGCRTVIDGSDNVVSVGTCPLCLPAGAITWLIENGRQLDLWGTEGVVLDMRGREAIENDASVQVQPDLDSPGLPF